MSNTITHTLTKADPLTFPLLQDSLATINATAAVVVGQERVCAAYVHQFRMMAGQVVKVRRMNQDCTVTLKVEPWDRHQPKKAGADQVTAAQVEA